MKKIIIGIIVGIIAVVLFMFAEYRYIMLNLQPYIEQDNTVYIEIFGRIDVYDAGYIE